MTMNKIKSKIIFLFCGLLFLLIHPLFLNAESYVAVTNGPWYDPTLYPDDPDNPEDKLYCGSQLKPFPVDWDEDGYTDILAGNLDGDFDLCYFHNNGDDTFERFDNFGDIIGADYAPLAVKWHEDTDDDYDLLFANGDIKYCENTGSSGIDGGNTFSCTTSYIDISSGEQLDVVDWNEDGFYDIIAGTSDGNLIYVENDGANHFTETSSQWQGIDFGSSAAPYVVDFNEDGFLDVVVGSGSEINLIINSGDNLNFTVIEEYIQAGDHMLEGESPKFLYWDEDNHLDIIMGYNGYVVLYLNDFDEDTYVGSNDCNNDDATVNIAATEICDGIDNNCDGTPDENNTADGTTYYADADEDTFGNPDSTIITCDATAPTGYVTDNTDCDDTAATANPDGTEVCDEFDNDCNGDVDESTATDAPEWYQDADGDGLGNAAFAITSCNAPTDFIAADAANPDCDDTDAALTTDCPAGDDDTTGDDDDTAASSGGCGLQGGGAQNNNLGLGVLFCVLGMLGLRCYQFRFDNFT